MLEEMSDCSNSNHFFTTHECLSHWTTWLDASKCSVALTAAISQAPPPATASMQLSPPTTSCGMCSHSTHTHTVTNARRQLLVKIVTKDKTICNKKSCMEWEYFIQCSIIFMLADEIFCYTACKMKDEIQAR